MPKTRTTSTNKDSNPIEQIPLRQYDDRLSNDTTAADIVDDTTSNDSPISQSASYLKVYLAPTDRGRDAWLCVLGCWLVEAMVRGTHLSFGVFQRYYSDHDLFRSSHAIPTIGALATGVSYLAMPFVNPIAIRYPQHRWTLCFVGWVMCLVGPLGASFAQHAWQLVLFQGFIEGIGWNIFATPSMFILNEHWVAKRGLATGILFGGSGVSGLILPIAFGWTLERVGFRAVLRWYIVAIVVVSGPGLLLIRPRRTRQQLEMIRSRAEETRTAKRSAHTMLRPYLTDLHAIVKALAVFVQGLGFFIPRIFLAQYATDAELSTQTGGALLAIVSFAQTLGQSWQGWVSDKVDIYIPLSLSTLIPGLGAWLLWGRGITFAVLAPFAFVWGFLSASYAVLFTRVCMFLAGRNEGMENREDVIMLLYGLLTFERGIANVLEGPISSLLLNGQDMIDINKYGVAKYSRLVSFTTMTMLASSLVGVLYFMKQRNLTTT